MSCLSWALTLVSLLLCHFPFKYILFIPYTISFSLRLSLTAPSWLLAIEGTKLNLSLSAFHETWMCIKTSHISSNYCWMTSLYLFFSLQWPSTNLLCSLWTPNAPDLDPMTCPIVSSLTLSFCLKLHRKKVAFHRQHFSFLSWWPSELIPHADAKPTQRSCSRECHIFHSLQRVPFHYK